MAEAIREAVAAGAAGEVPVGAVVVVDDKIVGRGRNRIIEWHDPTAHAELVAIRAATGQQQYCRLENAVLYTTLEPCVMCAGAIVLARIGKVVYAAKDDKAGAVNSLYNILSDNRLNHNCEVISGVEEEACKKILQDFFAELRIRNKQ